VNILEYSAFVGFPNSRFSTKTQRFGSREVSVEMLDWFRFSYKEGVCWWQPYTCFVLKCHSYRPPNSTHFLYYIVRFASYRKIHECYLENGYEVVFQLKLYRTVWYPTGVPVIFCLIMFLYLYNSLRFHTARKLSACLYKMLLFQVNVLLKNFRKTDMT
jgi:hypothetical protein